MFQCVFFIGAYAWLPPYMTPYLVKHYCLETGGCINLGNRFLKVPNLFVVAEIRKIPRPHQNYFDHDS